MQNSTDHDELSDFEKVVSAAADSELELLLEDAYDVPRVPRSLLKRLDRAVEQEWGVSPQLANQQRGVMLRSLGRGARLAWPIAACLALVVAAVAVFEQHAEAYGWTKMMDALSRVRVVQLSDPEGKTVRWMSISKGVLSERSARRPRFWDFNRQLVFQREAGQTQISRRAFSKASGLSTSEAVGVAFLLGNVAEEGVVLRQANLRVAEESWARASGGAVTLRVKLAAAEESIELKIALDRNTHLPRTIERLGSPAAGRLSVSYLDTDSAELLAQEFPAHLPVVDASAVATAVAAVETESSADETDGGREPENLVLERSEAPAPTELVGAASLGWKPVRVSQRLGAAAVAKIDATLAALWLERGVVPAEPADDEEMLRRVYLDLAGRTPSVSEARDYLADRSADRYRKLVDRLLASRDHATHLATVWRTLLIPEGLDLSRFGGTESFEKWIGDQFAGGVPYDEVVRRLLLAEGRLTRSGPLLFYAAAKLDPDQLATRSARVFLGMRLDCAQCHDDHFEPWLQEDFWGFAAFFARISRPQGVLRDVSTVMRVRDIGRGEVLLPESESVVSPRFLDGSPFDTSVAATDRRRQLADWMTADDNPFFARATANRVWAQLFGQGIVDPVDGFGEQHQAVSPELLDQLASQFIGSNYNLRELFRTIVQSRAYRLSSGVEAPDPERREVFAQMNVKLLTAEQMYDCITVASMLVSAESGSGFNLSRTGNTRREQFLQQFRAPAGRVTEYQAGIPQALTLMNGDLISNATGLASSGLLQSLQAPFISNKQKIEILYLATLSRRPTAAEWEMLTEFIPDGASGTEVQESLADVLWALLNSAEFTMNH